MTSNANLALYVGAFGAFLALLLLVAFIVHEVAKNRRLRAKDAAVPAEKKNDAAMPKEIEGGAYSYGSIVMDEVLEEKIIEGLKESLRMTEDMYKKLSEQFGSDRDRRMEIANDWLNYLEAIDNIKQARVDYRMNASDGESARIEKESARIKLEIEEKFKNLLQSPGVPFPGSGNVK